MVPVLHFIYGVAFMLTDQEEFDRKYISSVEICADLKLNRCSISQAVGRGELPVPIRIMRPDGVPHVLLWEREHLTPTIEAWRVRLNKRPSRRDKQV